MCFGFGVDAISLKHALGIWPIGHAFQQKGQQCGAGGFADRSKDGGKVSTVLATVVRRHLHACHDHFRASGKAGTNHLAEIGLRHGQGQASQGVVAAQLDHQDRWLM